MQDSKTEIRDYPLAVHEPAPPLCPALPCSWDFLAWLMQDSKMEFYEKSAAVCLFIRGVAIGLNVLSSTAAFKLWRKKRKDKKSKEASMWERLTAHT